MTRIAWIGCCISCVMTIIVTGLLLMPAMPGKPFPVPYVDKLVHAGLFFAVAFPAMSALVRTWHWPVWTLVVFYSGLTELVQPSFGRSAEWADLVANAFGAAMALLAARWARSKATEIQHRKRAKAQD